MYACVQDDDDDNDDDDDDDVHWYRMIRVLIVVMGICMCTG